MTALSPKSDAALEAAETGREFRKVLGHLPTGVVLVAAHTASGPVGMAVNSITSVSLDPPLVSICVARTSTSWPRIRSAGRFCISVLADHHEQTSRRFSAPGEDRFAGETWHDEPAGPALDGAVARLDCEMYAEYGAGDHTIVVARVAALDAVEDGHALVFFRGQYGRFVPHQQP
ncbi:flavin reductase family protein [Aeromicrobium wangtongii]|uniref:Flavin reductase family protein n=1 Tax=Aeromicrobium wangtongii TaxID=2969247 RepID=A0ABY5MAV0_9ACTN|nr:flavin reductase family protein [Aeromicrobium wangtongii]MCD9199073.1 flavin reductase family protein [Aeromicrobium wangtongii]MCL3820001.1 flavin reductase family protein [Aeromicrobium wangtongii]UUP12896.1 flavin reductase family protein [Aeromicrobium wangtongii]